jgi:hypothetical protein
MATKKTTISLPAREWAHGTIRAYPGDGPEDEFAIQTLFGGSRTSQSFYLTVTEARAMAAVLNAAADECEAVPPAATPEKTGGGR